MHIGCGMSVSDRQDQLDEVGVLQAMSKEGEFEWKEDQTSGVISGTMNVYLQLDSPIKVRLGRCFPNKSTPSSQGRNSSTAGASCSDVPLGKHSERTVKILYLPPICLRFQFPSNYPSEQQPMFTLSCKWINFTQVRISLCYRPIIGVKSRH